MSLDIRTLSGVLVILESLDLHFEEQPFAQSVKTDEVKRQFSEITIIIFFIIDILRSEKLSM